MGQALRFGPFVLDAANAVFTREGRRVELEPKAFDLLHLLATRPGQLVTKDEILDTVWGRRFVSESVVKTVISDLRAALQDDARAPRWIETVTRRGYRFLGASAPEEVPPAALAAPPTALQASAPPTSPALAAERAAPSFERPVGELHGRAQALTALQGALADALSGRRQVLFVAGEAGIGKSTLIEHFTSTALPAGAALALGQCVELYGSGEPYMPVLEALGMLCRRDDSAETVALMRRVAPTWLAQLPWLQDAGDRSTLRAERAGTTQDRMLREFGELVDGWTARRPLVLVLEDLHWSDQATVQLIGYLARRRGPAALLLLGTFRPADVLLDEHPFGGIRHELRLHRLCAEIELEALAEADVGALVAERLGTEGAEDFVRALHAHTEGLPLYVAHVLDEMLAAGTLRPDDGRAVAGSEAGAGLSLRQGGWVFPPPSAFAVPDTVTGVIDKQIARLPAERQRLLEAASVAGVEFMHFALAGPLNLDPEAVRGELDALAAQRHWLRSTGVVTLPDGRLGMRYSFRHALVRRTLYQRVGAAQRLLWHRRIAAALLDAHGAAADDAAAELAMHLERGGEPLAAARQLTAAATRALSRGAAQEALRTARHGLELLAPAAQASSAEPEAPHTTIELELRVLEGVALTRQQVITQPEVAEAFDRACALADRAGPSAARARALYGRWRVSFARAEVDHAHRLAQQMLERAGNDDPTLAAAARSALGSTLAMMGELAQARQQLVDVLAGGEADRAEGIFVQDPGVVSRGYLALVLWWAGEPAPARRLAAEAVARAGDLRHPLSQLIALNLAGLLHFYAGEPQRTLALVDELYEVIRQHGLPTAPGPFSWLHGHVAVALGRADEGFAEMREAERSCLHNGMRTGLSGFYRHFAEASRDAGCVGDALTATEQGIRFAETSGERFLLGPLLRLQAELALARGDAAGAAATLASALDVVRRQGAAFHEIGVRVAAARLPEPHPALVDKGQRRLRALLQKFEGEQAPVLQAARALMRP